MRSSTRRVLPVALLAVAALVLAACGEDDGAGVRSIGEDGGSSSSSSASASSPSGSGVAAAEKECEPVGADLEEQADATVDVALVEYAFEPAALEVDAGIVTFATTNEGAEAHELAFLPGGGEVPFTPIGVPDEDALSDAGAFELEAYGPEQSCNATYELEAGEYTLFCIVAAPDGTTHYENGMAGTLTVT